jgi:hypothetical protein
MAFSLGDISPLAGIATGKGMIGKFAGKGGLGLLPKLIANDAQEQRIAEAEAERIAGEEKKQAAMLARASTPPTQMKKGGVTSSASKRGDGIAQRGKTRGKMY